MRKIIVLITLVVALGLSNFSIYQRENHIKNGQSVFLRLHPVDPRSLMQGDYMALNFEISKLISKNFLLTKSDGFVVVTLNNKRVASFVSIYNNQKLKKNQLLIQYRIRSGKVKFATNAFFFQEGTGKLYENVKFGEFKVNNKHELLLISLHDKNLIKIE